MVGWGPWQSSARVQTKWGPAWYVMTASHGGYILVTQQGTPFGKPVWAVTHALGRVAVHEFEEDCNWAILEWLDEGVREWARTRHNQMRPENPISAHEYLSRIRDSIARYNPRFIG